MVPFFFGGPGWVFQKVIFHSFKEVFPCRNSFADSTTKCNRWMIPEEHLVWRFHSKELSWMVIPTATLKWRCPWASDSIQTNHSFSRAEPFRRFRLFVSDPLLFTSVTSFPFYSVIPPSGPGPAGKRWEFFFRKGITTQAPEIRVVFSIFPE